MMIHSATSCLSFLLLPQLCADESDKSKPVKVTEALRQTVSPGVKPLILMVEDNPADVALVEEALREHGVDCEMFVVSDGEKAIQHVSYIELGQASCPALIVLDLNLPRRHGRDVLATLRASRRCRETPVLVLSSSMAAKDIEEATALGATKYIRKPMDLDEFIDIGRVLKHLIDPPSGPTQ